MLSPHGWLGGSAPGPRFAFELASFIMLSPREWLEGSAPEPRFAFWLASFSSYRRVNGLRAVPLNPSSRLSWRVSSCCRRVNGLEAVHIWAPVRVELASFIMLSPREWLGSSAPEPRFAFKLASYTSCRCVNGLEETAFYLFLPPCVPPRCQRGGQPWEIAPSD